MSDRNIRATALQVQTNSPPGGSLPVGKAHDQIQRHHTAISSALTEYAARNRSWLRELFPTKLDLVLRDHQLNLARTICEIDERCLVLHAEANKEAAKEQIETWLRTVTLENKDQFIRFVTPILDTVLDAIDKARERLGERIRQQRAKADGFSDLPDFQALLREHIATDMREWMKCIAKLLDDFRKTVDKNLEDYWRPVGHKR